MLHSHFRLYALYALNTSVQHYVQCTTTWEVYDSGAVYDSHELL